jgi:hypothetical protein
MKNKMKLKLINISLRPEIYDLLTRISEKEDRTKSNTLSYALQYYTMMMYRVDNMEMVDFKDIDVRFPKGLQESLKKLMEIKPKDSTNGGKE